MAESSSTARTDPSGGIVLSHPVSTKVIHLLGIGCCLVLVLAPSIGIGELLPFPVMQIGALIIALLGLTVAPGLLRSPVLRIDRTGIELSSPELSATWEEIVVAGVIIVRHTRRSMAAGAPRVQARLELIARDSDRFRQAHPQAGRLSSRRQPSTYRINLRDRLDLAASVDSALVRSAPREVYQTFSEQ